MTNFVFNRDELDILAKAMKSSDTTASNSATPWARMTFNALLNSNGEVTTDVITASLISVYKPRTASGKLGTTVGSLAIAGHSSVAKRMTDIAFIMRNVGVEGVKPLIEAFIASDKPADSFNKLTIDTKAAIKAVAVPKAKVTDTSEGEGEGDSPPVPVTVSDSLAQIVAFVDSLTGEEINENGEAFNTLFDSFIRANQRGVDTANAMSINPAHSLAVAA